MTKDNLKEKALKALEKAFDEYSKSLETYLYAGWDAVRSLTALHSYEDDRGEYDADFEEEAVSLQDKFHEVSKAVLQFHNQVKYARYLLEQKKQVKEE